MWHSNHFTGSRCIMQKASTGWRLPWEGAPLIGLLLFTLQHKRVLSEVFKDTHAVILIAITEANGQIGLRFILCAAECGVRERIERCGELSNSGSLEQLRWLTAAQTNRFSKS